LEKGFRKQFTRKKNGKVEEKQGKAEGNPYGKK
jgi:hypothetical protein